MRRENTKFIASRCLLSSYKIMHYITRKLSYHKDDRAMRPIYMGALKIFDSPWVRPRLRNFKWAFVSINPMNVRTKFEVRIALSVPKIVRV